MLTYPLKLPIAQRLECARIVAVALDMYLAHGAEAVTLAQVALQLRLPLPSVQRYFPTGEPALLQAALTHHIRYVQRQLSAQRARSSTAVEELLAMRRFQHQHLSATRACCYQGLAARYPRLWHYSRRIRTALMLPYLRTNIERGVREGFYHAGLHAGQQARQWLQQLEAGLQRVPTVAAGIELHYRQISDLLLRLTTPLGAYVMRRLQEAPPYY